MNVLKGIRAHYPLLGLRGVLALTRARMFGRPIEITVGTPGIAHPIHLRVGTSDVSLFHDILLNKEYEWELLQAPRVIVDAGANVGFSSIYYANRYPQAKIVCVEPESSNAMVLRKNMAYYSNSLVVEAALWNENGPVRLVDPGLGTWGFRTVSGVSSVQGITVDRLMDQCSIDYIDLLKIDIEGAEAEVFADPSRWLDRVGAIVIEPHDRFRVGCGRSLYLATPDFSVGHRRGEMVFLARTGTVPPVQSSMDSTVN